MAGLDPQGSEDEVKQHRFRGAVAGALAGLATAAAAQVQVVPGMPPVVDPSNLYSEIGADKLSPAVAGHKALVYVPHVQSDDVYVIDPATFKVVDKYKITQ